MEFTNRNTIQIQNNIKQNIIKTGKEILEENGFINDLDIIMRNKSFKSFYDKYFNDFIDIKTVIMYMKLYETIQSEYKDKNGHEIESELLAYIIKELMSDNVNRKNILESFQAYMENKNDYNKLNYDNHKKFLLDIFDRKENGKLLN